VRGSPSDLPSFNPVGPYLSIANRELAFACTAEQTHFVLEILQEHVALAELLERVRELALPRCYVAGGAIPQILWNHFHRFDRNHGLLDFDVVYFDAQDLSAEREATIQARLGEPLPRFPVRIEAINEARVHVWYEADFGKAIEPFTGTEDAIYCFPTTASATGVTVGPSGEWKLFAPHGLTDLLGLVVRANKVQITEDRYAEKCARWSKFWPRLTIVPWA
jgi:hypothetical protein